MHDVKRLKPSLREKKRYLAYEIISEKDIVDDLPYRILKELNKSLGLFEGANAGLLQVKFDKKTQRGIIRMGRKYINKVKVAMMLMNQDMFADENEFLIRGLSVSGSLHKLEIRYFAS